jgi:hypothetical protein
VGPVLGPRARGAVRRPVRAEEPIARSKCLGLCGFSVGELVGHRSHDRGVADRTVVQRHAVNHRDRVEQAAGLDFRDDRFVVGAHARVVDVAVLDAGFVAKTAVKLSGNDRGDLLRRPRGASTAREAVGCAGNVEDLDDDRLGHGIRPFYLNSMAPIGHMRMHAPHPVHFSSTTLYAMPLGTIALLGHARRAGQNGLLSQRACNMVTIGICRILLLGAFLTRSPQWS